jgi:hypothetical protein
MSHSPLSRDRSTIERLELRLETSEAEYRSARRHVERLEAERTRLRQALLDLQRELDVQKFINETVGHRIIEQALYPETPKPEGQRTMIDSMRIDTDPISPAERADFIADGFLALGDPIVGPDSPLHRIVAIGADWIDVETEAA